MGTYHLNGRYNRIPKHALPVQEFVEPNPSDYFIYWLFKYRCIVCKQSATEINEIIPRSRSKKAIMDWKNRVPLCHEHHVGQGGYHDGGVTNEKIENMRKARKEFLVSVGREIYV